MPGRPLATSTVDDGPAPGLTRTEISIGPNTAPRRPEAQALG